MELTGLLSVLFAIILACCASFCVGSDDDIYFSLMISRAPGSLSTPSGVIGAVDQALDIINNDSNILPGFRLQYSTVLDTQCNRTRALQLYNEEVSLDNRTVVAVIGCGCSSATEEVASTNNGSIPVVSFDSTSITLSDRSTFPNVFRTVPSDESLPPALATLMNYYGWRQLTIITEREPQFMKLLPLFDDSLTQARVSVINLTASGPLETEQDIFVNDSRIFFLNTNPRLSLLHLCKAFQAGKHYPEYIWITPGWYQPGWWSADEEYLRSLNCSATSIRRQLNRSFSLLSHPDIGNANITKPFNFSTYAMDAVTTLAIALNETLVGSAHLNLSLGDAIKSTVFTGASGVVSFTTQGSRSDSTVLLQQFRMDSNGLLFLNVVATIDEGNFTYLNGENNSTLFTDFDVTGIPTIVYVLNSLKVPVYAYVLFLVTVGVILSLVCLLFNIIFRNRKVVKLTSPNLNYVIIFGAILLMVGNVFVPSPSQKLPLISVFCPISRIFLSVGYDICFVVALVKTIRVAYIFCNVSPVKKKIADWNLLILAGGIVMIEIVYTIPLLAVIYVNGDAGIVNDEKRSPFTNEQGYTVVNRMIICGNSSLQYIIYVSLSVTFKLIIHITGLVLAFLTRKVKIDPLNDSKFSAIVIYVSTVFLVIALVIIFVVEESNTYAGIWTTFVLIEVCMFLGMNFIPKMVCLYRDPKGEKVFGDTDSGTVSKNNFTTIMTVDNGRQRKLTMSNDSVVAESKTMS